MFVTSNRSQCGYTRDGQQKAGGLFLLIFSRHVFGFDRPDMSAEDRAQYNRELRACVRSVRMAQCGHFMMGSAQVGAQRITLSGTYGSDGLPIDASKIGESWDRLMLVPEDLTAKFWAGGGHNSAGSEGPDMRQWAQDNLTALRKAGNADPLKVWRLVWSPEGRTIAEGIQARTAKGAIRKAPKPYNRYKGEIYAEQM